jgi:monofunctional biosynthetic peptidoglycan transglycosylase
VVVYRGPDKPTQIVIQKKMPTYWVKLAQVSEGARLAIMVSEDWAFYEHKGFDFQQISEAIKKDWQEKKFARGASTITQQVVKNVFLEQDKNLARKVRELYLAIQLERALRKEKILEIYLNIAEWGEGVYGIKQASELYFNKHPLDLNAKEGAFLAMLLPSPKRYSQSFRSRGLTPYARDTIEAILEKMVLGRYLTEEEKRRLAAMPLSFEDRKF